MNKNLHRQINLLYFFEFLSNFSIFNSVSILFLLQRGFSLLDFGIAESIFHIVSLTFEIPSGILADLWGRKHVLAASQFCFALSSLAMMFSQSLFGICLSYALCALSYNLMSGSKEALLYDSLQQFDQQTCYLRINSNREFLYELSSIIGSLCSGIAQSIGYLLSYLLHVITSSVCFIFSLFLKEPLIKANKKQLNLFFAMKDQFVLALVFLRTQPAILLIMFTQGIIASVRTLTFFYLQQHFSQINAHHISIGLLFVFLNLGALLASKSIFLFRKYRWRNVLILCTLGSLSSFLLLILGNSIIISVLGGLSLLFFETVSYLKADAHIQQSVSSDKRATVISINSLLFSLLMLPLSPVSGWLADSLGLISAFCFLSILLLLLLLGTLIYHTKAN